MADEVGREPTANEIQEPAGAAPASDSAAMESKIPRVSPAESLELAIRRAALNAERQKVEHRRRSQTLDEWGKALVIINGVGAVALGAFLSVVWDKADGDLLLAPFAIAILVMSFGVALGASTLFVRYLIFFSKWRFKPFENPAWWVFAMFSGASVLCFVVGAFIASYGVMRAAAHAAITGFTV